MKNKLLSLLLAVLMVFSVMPSALFAADDADVSFNDIQNRYYENSALFWAEKGVISGDGKGAFKGEDPASRAETAKIICNVLGFAVSKAGTQDFYAAFKDVSKNAWYVPYLEALYNKGVMLGDGAGKMRPDAKISRQEIGTLICRAAGIDENPSVISSSSLKGLDKIASWAKGSMGALIGMGALKGDNNGNINAESNIKRGEFVTLMSNLVCEYIDEAGTYDLTGKKGIVIVKATPVTLEGSFDGNVIVSESLSGALVTVNADVSGKVVSFSQKALLTINGKTEQVLCEGDGTVVNLLGNTSFIQLGGDNSSATVNANVEQLSVKGNACTVDIRGGKTEFIDLQGENDTLTTLGVTENLVITKDAKGASVNVQIGGEINNAVTNADNSTFSGGGTLSNVTVNGNYAAINTSKTNYTINEKATNATSLGKAVPAGDKGSTAGSSAVVLGGGGGGEEIQPQTAVPVIKTQPQSISEPLSFGAAMGTFSVEVDKKSRHSYSYQWFESATGSYDDGVEISGAVSSEYVVPKNTSKGTHYVYCVVTAIATGAQIPRSTVSNIASFTVSPGKINILLIGGQAELGTNLGMADALTKLYEEQGIEATVTNTATSSTSDMRLYSLYSWSSTQMINPVSTGTYGTFNSNIDTALDPDASLKYDYVILSLGKTWNVAPNQNSPRIKEYRALNDLRKRVAAHNPDATVFVAAGAGFNTRNITLTDSGRTYVIASNRTDHMSRISLQANAFVNNVNKEADATDVRILELGYAAELAMQSGVQTVATSTYRNLTNNGALVFAMMIFSKTTGVSPSEITLTKWKDDIAEVKGSDLLVLQKSAIEALSDVKPEYEVVFDSVGGTPVESVKGVLGTIIPKPAAPTNGTYSFGGWYKDPVYSEAFDFSNDTVPLMGMTLYAKWVGRPTVEPVITVQPASKVVRYATSDSLSVQNAVEDNHTYSYQWYETPDGNVENGVIIDGATNSTLKLQRQYDLTADKYYYCEVTASLAGSSDQPKTVTSSVANVKVQKGTINILLIGGHSDLGVNRKADVLLSSMFAEQGINVNVKTVINKDKVRTSLSNLFTWISSDIKGFSASSDIASTLESDLASDPSVKYDYVICASTRTWPIITNRIQTAERTKEINSILRIQEMVYEHNSNALMVLLPGSGYNYSGAFGYTEGSSFTSDPSVIYYLLAENRKDHEKNIDARANELKESLDQSGVSVDSDILRLGNIIEDAIAFGMDADSIYYSANPEYVIEPGVYITALSLYSYISGKTPETVSVNTWSDGKYTYNSADAIYVKEAVLENVFGTKAEYQVVFDSCGGSAVDSVWEKFGSRITKPEDPTHENVKYTFGGWYKDKSFENVFDFNNDTVPVGGMTLYAFWNGVETEVPVITAQPSDLSIHYGMGTTITFEHDVADGHSYTYQWYKNTENSNENGTLIPGATEKNYVISKQTDNSADGYYYCVVTGERKGSLNGAQATATNPVRVTYEKALNILLIGGHSEFGLTRNVTDLITDMFAEKDITVNVNYSVKKDKSRTTLKNLFTWDGTTITGFSKSSDINPTLESDLASDASVKYDYVICASTRTWPAVYNRIQTAERNCEVNALLKIEEMVYEHNPNAVMILLPGAGYNYNEKFGFTSSSTFTHDPDNVVYVLGDNRSDHQNHIDTRVEDLISVLNNSETPVEFSVIRLGRIVEKAIENGLSAGTVYTSSYPEYFAETGTYSVALAIFTGITGFNADTVGVNTWAVTRTVDENDALYLKDAVNEVVNGKASEYELSFNTAGGEEMTKVTYLRGAVIDKPSDPVFEGRVFDGWYLDDAYTQKCVFDSSFVMPVGGITIYAKWLPEGYIKVYRNYYLQGLDGISYDLDTSLSDSAAVLVNSEVSLPLNTIDGFTLNTAASNVLSGVATENGFILKAYFTRNKYDLSYEYTGKIPTGAPALPAKQSVYYGATVNLFVPELSGYNFLGWSSDEAEVTTDGTVIMPAKDIVLSGKLVSATAKDVISGINLSGKVSGKNNTYNGNDITISGDLTNGYTISGTVRTSDNEAEIKPYDFIVAFEGLTEVATVSAKTNSGKTVKTENVTGTDGVSIPLNAGDTTVTVTVESDNDYTVEAEITLDLEFVDYNYYKPISDASAPASESTDISVYSIAAGYMDNDKFGFNDKLSEVAAKMGVTVTTDSYGYNNNTSATREYTLDTLVTFSGSEVTGWKTTTTPKKIMNYILNNNPDYFIVSGGRGPSVDTEAELTKTISVIKFIEGWIKDNNLDTKVILIDDVSYPDTATSAFKDISIGDGTMLGHYKEIARITGEISSSLDTDYVIRISAAFMMAMDKGLTVYRTDSANSTKPSDLGSYLIAYTIMANLTGEKPTAVSAEHADIVNIAARAAGVCD